MSDVTDLLRLAKDAVRTAANAVGAASQDQLKQVVRVGLSGKETTIAADVMLDALLLAGLSGSGLPSLTEESGATGDLSSGRCWVVDPLDGSVNYLRNAGPSAISVALCDRGEPVFGVVLSLVSGQLSWGGPQLGAWTEGAAITVSQTARTEDGLLCSGFPARFDPRLMPDFVATISRFAKVRMIGSAASSLLMVARGEADAYYEERIMLWDVAAGVALVRGAGGEVRMDGAGSQQPYRVVATNARIDVAATR